VGDGLDRSTLQDSVPTYLAFEIELLAGCKKRNENFIFITK